MLSLQVSHSCTVRKTLRHCLQDKLWDSESTAILLLSGCLYQSLSSSLSRLSAEALLSAALPCSSPAPRLLSDIYLVEDPRNLTVHWHKALVTGHLSLQSYTSSAFQGRFLQVDIPICGSSALLSEPTPLFFFEQPHIRCSVCTSTHSESYLRELLVFCLPTLSPYLTHQ